MSAFVCFFIIRAVHFGVSEPSTTDHCLSFFRRFSGCRGAQSLINFENCSNFLKALKLLRKRPLDLDCATIHIQLLQSGVEILLPLPTSRKVKSVLQN